MERFILIILISLASADDIAFGINHNGTYYNMCAEKYPLMYVTLPAKIIQSQENNHWLKSVWEEPAMQIYCFQGIQKHWLNMWVSVLVEISFAAQDYEIYYGSTPQEVVTAFEQRNVFWQSIQSSVRSIFQWKSKIIGANPGGSCCVGIHGNRQQYEIFLYLQQIDYWKPALLTSGIVLYLLAPKMSRSTIFFYFCTIIFGQCAALLILVYLMRQLVQIPKAPKVFLGFLTAGWLLGSLPLVISTITQALSNYIKNIASQNLSALLLYIGITSLISFIICYRLGLAKNPRTRNLVQWAMQIVSLYLMYMSSEFQDVSIVIIVLFLTFMNFPWRVIQNLKMHRGSAPFPSPRKLLTQEEYHAEGLDYTADSLEQLRDFYASPNCDQWAIVQTLGVPPKMVANFVLGSSHVTEEELIEHHQSNSFNIPEDESDVW